MADDAPHDAPAALAVQPTGTPNLDRILGGGIPRGALALVLGPPGAGKTTLLTQLVFAAAREGKTALITTALAEPPSKLIAHLRQFAFFDPALVGGPVQFLSLDQLLPEGLDSTGDQIVAEVRRTKADLVALDGFRGMRAAAKDPQAARRLLYTLGSRLGAMGVTTLVSGAAHSADPRDFPEVTTADIVFALHYSLQGMRHLRGIEIVKVRGLAPLPGLHALTIDRNGIRVYPNLEERIAADLFGSDAQSMGALPDGAANDVDRTPAHAGVPAEEHASDARAPFGIFAVDALLHGGLARGTSTLLAGSLGTGKTLLALHFALAGVRAGEHVVYASFRETQEQVLRSADAFAIGPELREALRPGGPLTFLHFAPLTLHPDIVADHLLAVLDQGKATRLIVDSIGEIEDAIVESAFGDPSRRRRAFLAALITAVRVRGLTTLVLKETAKAVSATLDFSTDALAVVAENVLLVQQMPLDGRLRRVFSVLKMRYSEHETAVHEFRIRSPEGIIMLGPLSQDDMDTGQHIQHARRRRPASSE